MFNPFLIVPLLVCLYEIISLIMPLKISGLAKILCALILLFGLAKIMILRRTPEGFDMYELAYVINLVASCVFNFIIVALFMLLIKDVIFIVWKIFLRHTPFPGHCASLFVFSLGICATLYGTYQGLKLPEVNQHEIFIENLGKDLDGMKIAMLVDIHADPLTNKSVLEAIVNRTNSLNPDLILIPGDFVDGKVKDRSADLAPLKNLKAKFGVYGSTGNHEYYFDYNGWIKEFKNLGINMLENEHIVITSGDSSLIIAGLPDQTGGHMGRTAPNIDEALKGAPENLPIILLNHQPGAAHENAKRGVTIQLSGHTHGGQMPGVYSLVKRANQGFVRGWYEVDKMKLYVSPGTSQWNGFSCRLFDPSEITLFILRSDSKASHEASQD